MPNNERHHGDDSNVGSSSPPATSTKSMINQYAEVAKKCGDPGSLPDGYRTDNVSRRCSFPWAANMEDRTLAAVMAVRYMTAEDKEYFKEGLEKSVADWKMRQTGLENVGESELGEAENDTEVGTETAERHEARSRGAEEMR